ncbi:YdcF family protein [Phormidium sp. LEGE 05292]|uniref:YdcF family protein n=1 Tax=[Phormidium] sp. LEGE 05292 TaxID=767427 RepID=UPI00187E4E2D|nr:YdcF family protein [Phormidium sp. LEGE 05292]MBE9224266.1 YdcF family protein [Phormidium sp. LEGE 05292]
MWQRKSKGHRLLKLAIISFLVVLISWIPVRIAIAKIQAPQPQAILTLGSWLDREYFTAQFATKHPNIDIWVSSGTPPEFASQIFRAFSIPESRVHLDYRAVDTITNFTTLIDDFKSRKIQHLYLITSEYHITRAKAIATLILGSQGIIFTPISVPSDEPSESWFRILRDIGRSLLWIFTGRTGASLNSHFEAKFSI